ncbi:MAG: hypothetical protein DMF55_05795 [Acidobacteria bacterium]|nr:MAG: hypothetical protein DMF55_05795 [Acidobacteriota bacterium]
MEGCPIVPGRLFPERFDVVQVFDRERIVEVRRDGNPGSLMKPVVGGVARNDGGRRALRGSDEVPFRRSEDDRNVGSDLRGFRRIVRNEQPHFELAGQRTGEFQRADPHPCHPRTDRLRCEHGHARRDVVHLPRTRSRKRCSFHVCEP